MSDELGRRGGAVCPFIVHHSSIITHHLHFLRVSVPPCFNNTSRSRIPLARRHVMPLSGDLLAAFRALDEALDVAARGADVWRERGDVPEVDLQRPQAGIVGRAVDVDRFARTAWASSVLHGRTPSAGCRVRVYGNDRRPAGEIVGDPARGCGG